MTASLASRRSRETAVHKDDVLGHLAGERSALRKYQDFFVGARGWGKLCRYELAHVLASPMPGAAGYVLRKLLLLPLLRQVGTGVQLGRGVAMRHPGKIAIGDRTAIDDGCLLDARGVAPGKFSIGSDVLISQGSVLTAKTSQGFIEIGDHVTIGKKCIVGSNGGIRIGSWVGIGAGSYLGGGRYRTEDPDTPILKQELYSQGPVVIEDDCWIGAGAIILDGVTIGRGSIIGAGAIIRQDISPFTVVTPHQRLVMLPRVMDTEDSDTPEA